MGDYEPTRSLSDEEMREGLEKARTPKLTVRTAGYEAGKRKAFKEAAQEAWMCMVRRGLAQPHRTAVVDAILALAKEKST